MANWICKELPRSSKACRRYRCVAEVDQNVQRSGVVDQAAELGRLTEMVSLFGGIIDLQGGKYGNAVLTRFE